MIETLILVTLLGLTHHVACQEQEFAPVVYAIESKPVTLPCSFPYHNTTMLSWKFQRNGTDQVTIATQLFPLRREYLIFSPFSIPRGRTRMSGGNLTINRIRHSEEGEYWCEIFRVNASTLRGLKYPVHVYVIPQDKVIALESHTLTANESSTAARCISKGGNPAAKITWFNGTDPMSESQTIVEVTRFREYLRDSYRDLVITSPTRYDHNRTFSCVVEHPTYEEPNILNYTVLVNHPPDNITIWANVTSKMVYCEADGGYPDPSYHWKVPGSSSSQLNNSTIEVPNLLDLPGDGIFECTADNGFPQNLTALAVVEDLVYPYKKPNPHSLHPLVIIGIMLAFVVLLTLVIYGVSRKLR